MQDTEKKKLEKIELLNQKVTELAEEQEKELVTDYDQALKEYHEKKKTHKLRFKGKIFELPASIPFSFSMFVTRNCMKKRNGKTMFEIPEDKTDEFISRMFGKEFCEEMKEDRELELDFVLQVLIPDVMKKWGWGIDTNPEGAHPERKNG